MPDKAKTKTLTTKASTDQWKAGVAAALAVLQAVLATVGGNNGGLTSLIVNEKALVAVAIGALFLALLLAAVLLYLDWPSSWNEKGRGTAKAAAFALFFFALVVTAIGTILYPSKGSRTQVQASLRTQGGLVLEGSAKADNVTQGTSLSVYIDGLGESGKHYYVINPTLYQAHVGPNTAGTAEESFVLPIPSGKYNDVVIDAWTGPVGQQCLPPKYFTRHYTSGHGCVVIRIANLVANANS